MQNLIRPLAVTRGLKDQKAAQKNSKIDQAFRYITGLLAGECFFLFGKLTLAE